jgi:mannose-6-phosphate isomerase-like protein (cupin superfamily)
MAHTRMKKLAKENDAFRRVVETGKYAQLVVMSLAEGENIGEETHAKTDQIFYFVDGRAEVVTNGKAEKVDKNEVVFIPAGTLHDIRNIGDEPLKLFTVYAPPEHAPGLVQKQRPAEHVAAKK